LQLEDSNAAAAKKKSTDVQWNEIDELREQQLFAAVQFGVAIQNNPVGNANGYIANLTIRI